jgi:hypothetical protein
MSVGHVSVVKKLVSAERVFRGDVTAQWIDDPDGRARSVALTLVREGGNPELGEDVQLVIPLDLVEVDILIAMLMAASRHVELARAKEEARQLN